MRMAKAVLAVGLLSLRLAPSEAMTIPPAAGLRTSSQRLAPLGGCLPASVTKNAEIAAFGLYNGDIHTRFGTASGDEVTSVVTVTAERAGRPTILLLSVYAGTVWDLSRVSPARVRGVVIHGYEAQAVFGLSPRIPLRFSTYHNPDPRCGLVAGVHELGPELRTLSEVAAKAFGRPIDHFTGSYNRSSFSLDGTRSDVPPSAARMTLAALQTSEPFVLDELEPGFAGLKQLVDWKRVRGLTSDEKADLSRRVDALFPPEKRKVPFWGKVSATLSWYCSRSKSHADYGYVLSFSLRTSPSRPSCRGAAPMSGCPI